MWKWHFLGGAFCWCNWNLFLKWCLEEICIAYPEGVGFFHKSYTAIKFSKGVHMYLQNVALNIWL